MSSQISPTPRSDSAGPISDGAVDGAVGEPLWLGLRQDAWLKILIVTVLFCALFRFNLVRLWQKTNPFSGESNWQHSLFLPLIGLYYLYVNRDDLLKAKVATAWTGLPILMGGILMFAYGIWPGRNDYVKDLGMIVTLFGTVLLLCGWDVMKIAWFPIAFLVCGIPWPPLVYSYVAMPLQQWAATVAVWALQFTGVTAWQGGTKIFIGGFNGQTRTLNVAEACAGLRSLMTFLSVAATVAFLSARPLWQKILISASAIPIAIFCNVMRVAGQGLLDHYVSPELSESFAHQFVGLIMLVPAFFLILMVGYVIDHIFVEEMDRRKFNAQVRSVRQTDAVAVPVPRWRTTSNRRVTSPAAQLRRQVAAKNGAGDRPAPPTLRSPSAPKEKP